MNFATSLATATGFNTDAASSCRSSVLLVDARSDRRAMSARQLMDCLPGVSISECSDESEAVLKLAAMKHALIVLDVTSLRGRARLASQYWRLTAPDMQQILVHVNAAPLSYLGRGEWHGVTHCSWSDMPEPLLNWARHQHKT